VLIWLFGLAVVFILVGVLGTVLPWLPGPPLVFAGLWLAAWTDGYQRVGWPTLVVLGLLTLVTVGVDLLAGALGARRARASRQAVIGAAIGSIVGLALGLPGLIVGPFVGAAGGEYLKRRQLGAAGRVGLATWLGMVVGGAIRLGLVGVMIGWFAVAFVM